MSIWSYFQGLFSVQPATVGFASSDSATGERVDDGDALALSAVYACTRLIAGTEGYLPVNVVRATSEVGVRTVMSEMGAAMMGTGTATGENRAREASERAINSPLLEDIDLSGAKGILVNITAGLDLSLGEFSEVGTAIEEIASDDATVVVGTVIDPNVTGRSI